MRVILKYWLVVAVWMAVIFGGSSDAGSFQHSSRIIEPVLHWLFPKLDQEKVNFVVFLARKCAHVTEYAILAMLIWRAIRQPSRKDGRPWLWRQALWALYFAAFFATTDEIHQLYVPSREGCIRDVIIDTCGSAAGILVIRQIGCWRGRW